MLPFDNSSTDFSTPPIWKEVQEYFGPIPLHIGAKEKWRIRAKLAVRGTLDNPQIGLFKPRTHEVEELLNSPDHAPGINEALAHIKETLSLAPYNEEEDSGALRYLQLTACPVTHQVQVVYVLNGAEYIPLVKKDPFFHSVWVNVQTGSTNTIFGPTWHHLSGPKYLPICIGGHEISLHPACFVQVHHRLFEKVLDEIKKLLLPQKQVVEFYAGVGAISLKIADKAGPIDLVEINPFAAQSFAESNPPSRLTYHCGPARTFLSLLDKARVLIVDPPRKGLDPELLDIPKSVEQILYLSCNFTTLKRDLEVLKKRGWKIAHASGYLLFPGTDHVEILVEISG